MQSSHDVKPATSQMSSAYLSVLLEPTRPRMAHSGGGGNDPKSVGHQRHRLHQFARLFRSPAAHCPPQRKERAHAREARENIHPSQEAVQRRLAMPQRAVELTRSAKQRNGTGTDMEQDGERALMRLEPDLSLAIQR